MVPIKIECGCGQRFAFEVEPVNGQMPSPVACPACGGDATSAANEVIAQSLPTQPVPVAARAPVMVAASPAPRSPASALRIPGQVDPSQAVTEAKAKVLWGDSPEEVTKYLMLQGFSAADATEVVQSAFKERAAAIRSDGIRKIFIGIGMVIAMIAALPIVRFSFWLMAFAGVSGLTGLWKILEGTLMALAPKSEKGDINDK